MAVLTVLAACGDLGCTRERLLSLLWPESDEARARQGLRDALYAIRQALTPGSIQAGTGLLRLDPTVVGSDVLEFSKAVESGRLADAVRAYSGPLLEGCHLDGPQEFENWLAGERARLDRECVEALAGLASSAERTGSWAEAARWWGRAVNHDPLNSHFVVRQMQGLAALGDRANALQIGELHVRRLRQECGLAPDPAILDTMGRIRRGELAAPGNGTTGVSPGDPAGGTAPSGPLRAAPDAPESQHREPRPSTAMPLSARAPRWLAWAAGIAAVGALAFAIETARQPATRAAGVRPPRTSIAVMPFRNLTADSAAAYLADGLHDELLSQLAQVAELRVIGSASVHDYPQASLPLERIGEELAVGSIVQTSVQTLGKQLRVIVQLVDPFTGAELWAESYDRTLDDAFAVQSDIAQRIVSAVGVTLSRAEVGGITAAPTANAEAYLLYLQGLEYARRPGDRREDLAVAEQLYERALRLDSHFALAHAALSTVHGRVFWRRYDTSPGRTERQLQEARAALRFAPALPEAHVAMALAYCCGRRSDQRALEEYTAASHRAPNDASLWEAISLVHARLGNWDRADSAFERARRLDPRDATLYLAQGNRLHCRRRYAEAIETYRRALVLAPDFIQPHIALAWSFVLWRGQLDTLRAALGGLADVEPGGGAPPVGLEQAIVLMWDRRPDSLLALLRTLRRDAWTSGETFESRLALAGSAYFLTGDSVAGRAAFDSAATMLDSALRVHPGDAPLHMQRGGIMAALGRRAEALREVRWLEHSDGYLNNHSCPSEPEARAAILVRLGQTDSALAAIERLLAGRSRVSVHTLRLDPLWDPIRSDPRFQALLARYADPAALSDRTPATGGGSSAAR